MAEPTPDEIERSDYEAKLKLVGTIPEPDQSAIRIMASILDHPSIYMGGPSYSNLRMAIRLREALISKGKWSNG